jgi:hypothetical protein
VIDENWPAYAELLGVQDWTLTFKAGKLDAGTYGQVQLRYPYKAADIYLDPSELADTDHAKSVLRHELIHVMLADFDDFADALKKSSGLSSDVHYHLADRAFERMVYAVEQLIARLQKRSAVLVNGDKVKVNDGLYQGQSGEVVDDTWSCGQVRVRLESGEERVLSEKWLELNER